MPRYSPHCRRSPFIAFAVASLALACALPASAAGIGVRAGTNGLGGDVGFDVLPTLSARIGYSGFNLSHGYDDTSVHYDGKLKLANLSGLLDWSPLGPFRATAGLVLNDNKVSLTGRPTGGSYTFNGHRYDSSTISAVSGELTSGNRFAPYLGVGYGNVSGFGVNVYTDLGVILQGSPKASVNASCKASAAVCSQLADDVRAEQASLASKAHGFKYYPVASIGLTIGF
jgi:hypothetical protein